MIRRVVLHIGHDKTATTSIQETFKRNRTFLEKNDYCYPVSDGNAPHNRLFVILFKEGLRSNERLLLSHSIDVARIDKIRDEEQKWLTSTLHKAKAKTIIFSSEHLPTFNTSELQAIKKYFTDIFGEVKFEIYGYTRNPEAYSSSAFQQRARLFPSAQKTIYFLYRERIGKFIDVFGRENIRLFKFEEACKYSGGPVCFLLDKIGFDNDFLDQMRICNANEGLSHMAIDLYMYINTTMPYTETSVKQGFRTRGDCKFLKSLPGSKIHISEEDVEELREKTRDEMGWLQEEFDIHYSMGNRSVPEKPVLVFDECYVEKMIIALRKSNPIVRKLIYEYLSLKVVEIKHDPDSVENVRNLMEHFKTRHLIIWKLPYSCFTLPQRIIAFFYNLLRRSRKLRQLKHRLMDKVS